MNFICFLFLKMWLLENRKLYMWLTFVARWDSVGEMLEGGRHIQNSPQHGTPSCRGPWTSVPPPGDEPPSACYSGAMPQRR